MCGAVGRVVGNVFSGIGSLFGGGGGGSSYSSSASAASTTPTVQKINPSITNVTSSDVGSSSSSESEANKKQRAKRGYAATRLAVNKLTTLAGNAGRSTLG